jgi:uncharacterized membrane protein
MASLNQAKTLGGVGSILMILALIPSVGWLVAIVGAILVLIAVKYISDVIEDKSVFNNYLISVILNILALAVGGLVIFASFWPLIFGSISGGFTPELDIITIIFTVIIALVVVWIFYIVSAIFLRKSFNTISSRLNISMFGTAALLYLIGAALMIVVIGFIIILIADILQIVAFFSISEQTPPEQTPKS